MKKQLINQVVAMLFAMCLFQGKTHSQSLSWLTKPYDHRVFIQNLGQFRDSTHDTILFGAFIGNGNILLTKNGIVFQYTKYATERDTDTYEEDTATKYYQLQAKWIHTNPGMFVTTDSIQSYYYTFGIGSGTIRANAYRGVTYHNLYPGIDANFSLVGDSNALVYTLTVHPYANLSQVKLVYDTVTSMSINSFTGDMQITARVNNVRDKAPVCHYIGNSTSVNAYYSLSGDTESYSCPLLNPALTLVIDPRVLWWITGNPYNTPSFNTPFDLDFDNLNHVYVYGGYPFELAQLNSVNGAINWIFITLGQIIQGCYGDFAVQKSSGISFIFDGCAPGYTTMVRVDKSGNVTGRLTTTAVREGRRVEYDTCKQDIVIGGGEDAGPNTTGIVSNLNAAVPTVTGVNTLSVTPSQGYSHDAAMMALDPAGDSCYVEIAQSGAFPAFFNNVLLKAPVTALSPASYITSTIYGFQELFNPYNTNPYNQNPGVGRENWGGAYNGMVANPCGLFLYDGSTLAEYDRKTGIVVPSYTVTVPNGRHYMWSGMDADINNVYLGDSNSIYEYSINTFTPTLFYTFSNNQDVIYDLHTNPYLGSTTGAMYVCGGAINSSITNPMSNGFVASLFYTPSTFISSVSSTPSCSSPCTGTATVTLGPGCVPSGPYTYYWSNGETTATATGLCPGTYSVSVVAGSGGCNTYYSSFASVTIGTVPGPPPPTISGPVYACGSSPYTFSTNPVPSTTYSWAVSGGTNNTVSPTNGTITYANLTSIPATITCTATYTVTGCSTSATFTVEPCCSSKTFTTVIVNETATQFGTYAFSGQTVLIEGTYTINHNVSFHNCDVEFTPDAQIIVQNGNSLIIEAPGGPVGSTHLHAACPYMWQGIVVEPGATCEVGYNTLIEDADTAIIAVNQNSFPYVQGIIDIPPPGGGALGEPVFNKNYRDIIITPTPLVYAGSINPGTIFTCRDLSAYWVPQTWYANWASTSFTTLLSPHLGQRTHMGIEATNVYTWTNFPGSVFDNMDYGVYAYQSSIGVYGCTFQYIMNSPSNIAVYDYNIPSGPPTYSLIVGNMLSNNANTFINCNIGVEAQYITSVQVENNIFDDNPGTPFAWAVYQTGKVAGITSNTVSIQANNIDDANVGIEADNNMKGEVVINYNIIYSPYCSLRGSKGICASEVSGTQAIDNIEVNNITVYNIGIQATGLSKSFIDYNMINLGAGTPYYPCTPSTYNGYGIVENACIGLEVCTNTVTPITSTNTYTAISQSGTTGTNIEHNYIDKANIQIGLNAPWLGDNLWYNSLNVGTDGILATMTYTVGAPGNASDNTFAGLTRKSCQPLLPLSRYYYSTAVYDPNPVSCAGLAVFGGNGRLSHNCVAAYPIRPHSPTRRSGVPPPLDTLPNVLDTVVSDTFRYVPDSMDIVQLGKIARNVDTFPWQDTAEVLAKEEAIWMLWANPSLMSGATLLRNFNDSVSWASLGEILSIDTAMISPYDTGTSYYTGLLEEVNAITPANIIENNLQVATSEYLSFLISNTLSTSQLNITRLLANQCYDWGGSAVYLARDLLTSFDTAGTPYNDTCGGVPLLLRGPGQTQTAAIEYVIKLYPNPNNGNFTLEYNIGTSHDGRLLLYNTLGQVMGDYSLNGSEGKKNISNPQLSNGIYFWKVFTNSGVAKVGKVIIMK